MPTRPCWCHVSHETGKSENPLSIKIFTPPRKDMEARIIAHEHALALQRSF
jgi:hypothetical protein